VGGPACRDGHGLRAAVLVGNVAAAPSGVVYQLMW
jgi:hypothetical protein